MIYGRNSSALMLVSLKLTGATEQSIAEKVQKATCRESGSSVAHRFWESEWAWSIAQWMCTKTNNHRDRLMVGRLNGKFMVIHLEDGKSLFPALSRITRCVSGAVSFGVAHVGGDFSARFDLSTRCAMMEAMTICFINKTLCFHLFVGRLRAALLWTFHSVGSIILRSTTLSSSSRFTLMKVNNLIRCSACCRCLEVCVSFRCVLGNQKPSEWKFFLLNVICQPKKPSRHCREMQKIASGAETA